MREAGERSPAFPLVIRMNLTGQISATFLWLETYDKGSKFPLSQGGDKMTHRNIFWIDIVLSFVQLAFCFAYFFEYLFPYAPHIQAAVGIIAILLCYISFRSKSETWIILLCATFPSLALSLLGLAMWRLHTLCPEC